jgi:outer membrane protein TolC
VAAKAVALLTAFGLLAGCAVGPDFTPPAAPATNGYTKGKLPSETGSADVAGGAAQHFVDGLDIPGQWWRVFRSPALNKLVAEALQANPTLVAG